ncbi:MAG: hypothetical protein IPP14_08340 [Planctomycetes bacterium]|nr:hypothetical protein [Planctomycetota bacterium]
MAHLHDVAEHAISGDEAVVLAYTSDRAPGRNVDIRLDHPAFHFVRQADHAAQRELGGRAPGGGGRYRDMIPLACPGDVVETLAAVNRVGAFRLVQVCRLVAGQNQHLIARARDHLINAQHHHAE